MTEISVGAWSPFEQPASPAAEGVSASAQASLDAGAAEVRRRYLAGLCSRCGNPGATLYVDAAFHDGCNPRGLPPSPDPALSLEALRHAGR